ncbi:MAG: hypothetical protein MRK00_06590 [Nitrosomonas sp.]|nr:hypothetical protein [Nitrosomonas sp.]
MTAYKVEKDATGKCHIFKRENDGSFRKISDSNGEVHTSGGTYKAEKKGEICCVYLHEKSPGGNNETVTYIMKQGEIKTM